jgi:hypothetical protein
MLNGLFVMLAVAAQGAPGEPAGDPPGIAVYGPMQPAPPKPAVKPPSEPCKMPDVKQDTTRIVVCAPKVEGYRIDPDVLEAKRAKKNRNRPRRPERLVDNSCATIGPMGCRGVPTIDIVNAALALASMAQKAAKGENVGQMFITDPTPSEYQLYQEAKRRREAKEAEEAAFARAKAAESASTAN